MPQRGLAALAADWHTVRPRQPPQCRKPTACVGDAPCKFNSTLPEVIWVSMDGNRR